MADKKITKRDVINALLKEDSIKANTMYVDFLNHEIELLDKKSSSKAPTKTQKENEIIKETILDVLNKFTSPAQISELQSASEELDNLSNQKVATLLGQLANDGKVVRIKDKKSTFFTLA